MKLIDEWRQSWRWLSVQFAGLSAVAPDRLAGLARRHQVRRAGRAEGGGGHLGIAAAVLLRLVKQRERL